MSSKKKKGNFDFFVMTLVNNQHWFLPEESSLIVTIPELTKNFLAVPSPSKTVITPGFKTANDGT